MDLFIFFKQRIFAKETDLLWTFLTNLKMEVFSRSMITSTAIVIVDAGCFLERTIKHFIYLINQSWLLITKGYENNKNMQAYNLA